MNEFKSISNDKIFPVKTNAFIFNDYNHDIKFSEDNQFGESDFKQCIKNTKSLEPKINSKITPKLIKLEEQKQKDEEFIDEITEASIFSIVHSTTNDSELKLYRISKELNHFDLVQDLCFFQSLPLSLEEFKKEILLLKPDLKLDKFFKKFTYKQDYTTLSKLTYLKKLYYKYIDDMKNLCKKEEEIDQETKEDISKCYTAIEKIDKYYLSYWKEDFVRHNFISFKNSPGTQTKTQFLFYNCFKISSENTIYQVNPDTTLIRYKNITELANIFRLSGTTAQRLYQNMVVFGSVREFKLMMLESKYKPEPIDDLLDMLKNTFVYESDYKYYLSWLANKVTYQTTNGRGIISQPEIGDSGCDSLKTYMISLLEHFIEVYNADLKKLNRPSNGTYFKGLLIVMEELPRKITDIKKLLTILEENTRGKLLKIKEKGEKPTTIQNRIDIVINTNFNVERLFYFKSDASALSKKFRILTRKSIDVKKYSNVLDKYAGKDINFSNAYQFYRYLYNNDELIKYYEEHSKDKSEIEKKYLDLAIEIDDIDKISTNQTLEEFIEQFKQNYVDKNKNIKINKLLKLFNDNRMFTNMKQKSFKRMLILKKCVHIERETRAYVNDEEIKNIYDNFFTYEEDAELDLKNVIL